MKELLIRQRLNELETDLVRRAEAAVDNMPDITKKLEGKQIRNVIAVAEETQSIAVVDNFVKYQIGRSKANEGWRFGEENGQGFGERLRADLEWLKQQAASKAGSGVTSQDLEIRLIRLYLGYLMRHFKYAQVQPRGGG